MTDKKHTGCAIKALVFVVHTVARVNIVEFELEKTILCNYIILSLITKTRVECVVAYVR